MSRATLTVSSRDAVTVWALVAFQGEQQGAPQSLSRGKRTISRSLSGCRGYQANASGNRDIGTALIFSAKGKICSPA